MINFSLLYIVYWPYAHSTHVCVTQRPKHRTNSVELIRASSHFVFQSAQSQQAPLSASAIRSTLCTSNVRPSPRCRRPPPPSSRPVSPQQLLARADGTETLRPYLSCDAVQWSGAQRKLSQCFQCRVLRS